MRNNIDIDTKKKIIIEIDKKEKSYSQIASIFNIPKSSVSTINKNRNKITNIGNILLKNLKIYKKSIPNVEILLFDWINDFTQRGLIITDIIVQGKAKYFYDRYLNLGFGLPLNFKFSNGWLYNFKKKI